MNYCNLYGLCITNILNSIKNVVVPDCKLCNYCESKKIYNKEKEILSCQKEQKATGFKSIY